ncbi:HipA-like protein [Acidovorax sp. NO-1]|nr:HipA-like protein [Acidovorax sp. NO-1]
MGQGAGRRFVGQLFQYGEGASAITRLVPDRSYWTLDDMPVLAQFAVQENPDDRFKFVLEAALQPFFNGEGEALPPFFQNMLPEGPLRTHLESIGDLDKGDDFALLSMCGTDLPGAVYVAPADMTRESIARVVTQNNDALEMSVSPMPLPEATSLSGVQPKLALVLSGGRYVARAKDERGVHIIAKLPTVQFPLLPQVEELSMRMAGAAGVDVCEVTLAPLSAIHADQPFVIGDESHFLAVKRFDRQGLQHIHCEDFAQVLNIPPTLKYEHPRANYATMAKVLLSTPGLGMPALEEFIRRIVVNDLLGNFDGHVKNYGLLYADGRTPELSPAYDVVAYAAFLKGKGHALKFTPTSQTKERISPAVIRALATAVPGLPEPKIGAVVRETAKKAYEAWPDMIQASGLQEEQKRRLLEHIGNTPAIESLARRAAKVPRK